MKSFREFLETNPSIRGDGRTFETLSEEQISNRLLYEGLVYSLSQRDLIVRLKTGIPDIKILRNDHSLSVITDSEKLTQILSICGWFIEEESGNMKYLSPKYDVRVDVPDILFHVTPSSKVDKILKTGLQPRSNNRIQKHPERIYFATGYFAAETILRSLSDSDSSDREYSILKVEVEGMKNGTKFFVDRNFYGSKDNPLGVYTLSNIHPRHIEVYTDFQ